MQQLDRWIRIAAVVPVVAFGVATLVASGGFFSPSPFSTEGGVGGATVATAKRYPVVAVSSNGTRAAIMTTGRENDDSQRPVQKFGNSFGFVPPALGQPTALAGSTAQTFIAGRRPDLSGRNDSLAIDVSGIATALWGAGNAGTPELYANQYSVVTGDWSPRQLLATLGSRGLSAQRIAMDGFGRTLAAWSEGDGLIHTRVFLPGQGWLAQATITDQLGALADVAMRRNQGHALFTSTAGDTFIAQLDNFIWGAPIRVGSGAIVARGSPRLAVHRDAPGGSLIAVWAQSDGIYINRLTATGPEFANGQKIPGSDNGSDPQVVMGANEETTVIWGAPSGATLANRAIARAWGTAQQIEGGANHRLAGDAQGNAVVVYGATKVYATRFIRASGWQATQEIGGDMVAEGVADVAMDDNGRGLVVWEQAIAATPDPLDTRIATAVIGAPIARFSSSPDPATVGAPIVFDATASSDLGGSIARYDWYFTGQPGADVISQSPTVNHTFTQPGMYPMKLVVTDNSGLVAEATKVVVVGAVLSVTVVGSGSVSSTPAGIACPADCSEPYAVNTDVTLTAAPGGSPFTGWSGDCTGAMATTAVRMSAARSCTATFATTPVGGWQPVGSPLASSGGGAGADTNTVSIAVSRSVPSRPVIFAATALVVSGHIDLVVQQYDELAAAWTPLGIGPINADAPTSNVRFTPAIAIEGGRPVVAWAENGERIRVKKWNGTVWVLLSDNLNVDPAASVSGTQIATAQSELVVAWVEGNSTGTGGRMALKRLSPFTPGWTGGAVLPSETNVLAVRLTTEAAGTALLMFVPHAPGGTREGPLRVLREGAGNTWADVCNASLSPPPPANPLNVSPNTLDGFGVARSAVTAEPVAVIHNGEAVFVRACRGGAWIGLDGSAQGRVTPTLLGNEFMGTLGVAQSEGMGVALVWSKVGNLTGGGSGLASQVMVENSSASAMVASGTEFARLNGDGSQARSSLQVEITLPGSPVLGTFIQFSGSNGNLPQVFRYLP